MRFQDLLERYLTDLGCTAKELSEASGLSAAVISRYRSGERRPSGDGKQLHMLAEGVAVLSRRSGGDLDEGRVYAAFSDCLDRGPEVDCERVVDHLDLLISLFDVNLTELAHSLNFDPSYLSRIRSGQRHPSDLFSFVAGVSSFIVRRYDSGLDKAAIAELIGVDGEMLSDRGSYMQILQEWLSQGVSPKPDLGVDFVRKLDEFDLDEYIRSIRFDDLKVPPSMPQLPSSRLYVGLEQMKVAEIDFLKSAVLSRSTEPVVLYSDMPITDLVDDLEFRRKCLFGVSMMLKKGLHVDMIHDLNRPFDELLLGLQDWIPLYMTGQISPYYLPGKRDGLFQRVLHVSGEAAITGEAIDGCHDHGCYRLSRKETDITYARQRADDMLARAHPLMDIYREPSRTMLHMFLESDSRVAGERRRILSSLPVCTLDNRCLEDILDANHVDEDGRDPIREYVRINRALAERVLLYSPMTDEVPDLSREEFEAHPMALSLSGMFHENDIIYSYEQYRRHLELTYEYAGTHGDYRVRTTEGLPFRNIQITMHKGRWALISKVRAPIIHLVIRHPKLRKVIEGMAVTTDASTSR